MQKMMMMMMSNKVNASKLSQINYTMQKTSKIYLPYMGYSFAVHKKEYNAARKMKIHHKYQRQSQSQQNK